MRVFLTVLASMLPRRGNGKSAISSKGRARVNSLGPSPALRPEVVQARECACQPIRPDRSSISEPLGKEHAAIFHFGVEGGPHCPIMTSR
jgi:hypothetical protein